MTSERTGYNLREGAAMIAERIDQERDERVLVNAVTFLFEDKTPSGTYRVLAKGSIDKHGHVDLSPASPWTAADGSITEYKERVRERCAEMADALIDAEMADWRGIGAGDTELYATPRLLELVAPAHKAMPDGWQPW